MPNEETKSGLKPEERQSPQDSQKSKKSLEDEPVSDTESSDYGQEEFDPSESSDESAEESMEESLEEESEQ